MGHERDRLADVGGKTLIQGIAKSMPRRKLTACGRCHSRKTKCSGEHPCQSCIAADLGASCSYLFKDRMVRVNESQLQRLLLECETAKQSAAQPSTPAPPSISQSIPESSAENKVSNLLIEDKAWFVPHTTPDIPVYVGESASTAFASSLCQVLDSSFHRSSHAPRTHYLSDQHLTTCADSNTLWPSEARAKLLINGALTFVNRVHHIVLPSTTLNRLDRIYRDLSQVTTSDTGKFFNLFALGEAYMGMSKTGDTSPPGLPYFTAACRLVQVLPERSTLETVENLLLLSLYSQVLNRRHSAYQFVGSALRLSMTLGLHHALPQYITIDPITHQHRVRIWWTVYCFERTLGSELGHPPSIQDQIITVELPSITGLGGDEKEDFADPDYAIAQIDLARVIGDAIVQVYNRRQTQPFIGSVRRILRGLKEWIQNLPASLWPPQTQSRRVLPRDLVSLHLTFNQSVILVTRPVLLYILRQELDSDGSTSAKTVSPTLSVLADASIHSAKQLVSLQSQCWIDGMLPKFGYSDAHYLFSSATILMISSMLSLNTEDALLVDTASDMLRTLASNGSFPASEFVAHLEIVEKARDKYMQGASAKEIHGDRINAESESSSIQKAAAGTILENIPMQDFSLDGEMDLDDIDFFNPLVGFENEILFEPGGVGSEVIFDK